MGAWNFTTKFLRFIYRVNRGVLFDRVPYSQLRKRLVQSFRCGHSGWRSRRIKNGHSSRLCPLLIKSKGLAMRPAIVMISLLSLTQATLEFSVWICGRSSGVERNLAKVDVVSSNLIARSIYGAYLNSYLVRTWAFRFCPPGVQIHYGNFL